MQALYAQHEDTIKTALTAIGEQKGAHIFPDHHKDPSYGDNALANGESSFLSLFDQPLDFGQPGTNVGAETSRWTGEKLGITYPHLEVSTLVNSAFAAGRDFATRTDPQTRAGICMEILDRCNKISPLLGAALMHLSGQGQIMAFQQAVHGQDRGVEVVAWALKAFGLWRTNAEVSKRVGRSGVEVFQNTYCLPPLGVGAVLGCRTFSWWNSVPPIIANIMTGNATIVKTHPMATLALALFVREARAVLREQDLDPNLVMLAPDTPDALITKELAKHQGVRIIDCTGGPRICSWLRANVGDKVLNLEGPAVNWALLDSCDNLGPVVKNIALSALLASGFMCTSTGVIAVPETVNVNGENVPFDKVKTMLVEAMTTLANSPHRQAILGCFPSDEAVDILGRAVAITGVTDTKCEVLVDRERIIYDDKPSAIAYTPLILLVDSDETELLTHEFFGPIVRIVRTRGTNHSITLAAECCVSTTGSTGCSLYSTSEEVIKTAEATIPASLNINFSGDTIPNQIAAFCDPHISRLNPAGTGTFCDLPFILNRTGLKVTRRFVSRESAA